MSTVRQIKAVRSENERLRKQLAAAEDMLIAGPDKVLRCAFCGEPYPDGTPTHKSAILAAHIRECKVHPVGIENRALLLSNTHLLAVLILVSNRLFTLAEGAYGDEGPPETVLNMLAQAKAAIKEAERIKL